MIAPLPTGARVDSNDGTVLHIPCGAVLVAWDSVKPRPTNLDTPFKDVRIREPHIAAIVTRREKV